MPNRAERLHELSETIALDIKALRTSWAFIIPCVRYTGEVLDVPTGKVRPAIHKGATIYRHVSDERDEFNYPVEDAFYADEALTILISKRHD